MASTEDLLRPTLGKQATGQPAIYSTTTGYLTAFVGGPFAAIAMAALNSWRLRRLAIDALPLLAATALSVAVFLLFTHPELLGQTGVEFESRTERLWSRLFALIVFSAFWLIHRRYYRGMELLGLTPPNAWAGGIACVLMGTAVTLFIDWVTAT